MIRIRLTEIVENLNIKLEHKNIGKNVCMLFFVLFTASGSRVAHVAIATPILHVIASGTAAAQDFLAITSNIYRHLRVELTLIPCLTTSRNQTVFS